MKYVYQLLIIMAFVVLGEIMGMLIPLPIAGGIYGLILLFLALTTGLVKLSWVADVADWLHSIMALFFIAPAVAIIEIWSDISGFWWILVLLLIVAYLITMVSTGLTAQATIKETNKKVSKSKAVK